MGGLRSLEGVDIHGKRVLVRIDADVDLDARGAIEPRGDHRLLACLPTIQLLRERGARVILLSHLGRPQGAVVERLRLTTVGQLLGELLGAPIRVLPVTTGPAAREAVEALQPADILLLENVRFDPREEQNDEGFARELASLADLYVNEAFAVSHRAHASVEAITRFVPSVAGPLLAREVAVLEKVLTHPEQPVVAVVSGAKLETKIALLRNLLPKVARLLTGGGIANMFLAARGANVGASLVEPHMAEEVRALERTYAENIIVPTDVRVGAAGLPNVPKVVAADTVGRAEAILDIGPDTVRRYCEEVSHARTCIWNGPLGKVELPAFQEGTRAFAECLAASDAYSLVGGGDTVTALRQMGLQDRFDHVSTGGGAMIAFLEGVQLPGVEALRR